MRKETLIRLIIDILFVTGGIIIFGSIVSFSKPKPILLLYLSLGFILVCPTYYLIRNRKLKLKFAVTLRSFCGLTEEASTPDLVLTVIQFIAAGVILSSIAEHPDFKVILVSLYNQSYFLTAVWCLCVAFLIKNARKVDRKLNVFKPH